jgi:hypothetical protein
MSRLAIWGASAIGLGVLVASAAGDLLIARSVELGVAAGAVTLAARVPAYRGLLAGLVAVGSLCAELVLEPVWTTAPYAVLLALFVWCGAGLARELAGYSDWDLGGAALPWVEQGNPPVLDLEAVSGELNRARRYQRPLSILTIALPTAERSPLARRRVASDLAASLSMCLRQSDLLGHQGASRLVAVLPETSGGDARLLRGRVHALLDPDVAGELKFGIASFPDEEVTWVGLEDLAVSREAPVEVGTGSRGTNGSASAERLESVPAVPKLSETTQASPIEQR